jgi:hypothetical protein
MPEVMPLTFESLTALGVGGRATTASVLRAPMTRQGAAGTLEVEMEYEEVMYRLLSKRGCETRGGR